MFFLLNWRGDIQCIFRDGFYFKHFQCETISPTNGHSNKLSEIFSFLAQPLLVQNLFQNMDT